MLDINAYIDKNFTGNQIDKAIQEMRASNVPVFIWGGAKLAQKIKWYLESRGIEISGFLINREFWNSSIQQWNGTSVFMLEEYLPSHRCSLVVGFAGYRENQLGSLSEYVCRVYALDFMGALCLDGCCSTVSYEFYQKNRQNWNWLSERVHDCKSRKAVRDFLFQRMTGVYQKEDSEPNAYFVKGIVVPQEDEVFVNCGAYHGEEAFQFVKYLHEYGIQRYQKIFCIEADPTNAEQMRTALKSLENVEIIEAGVWDQAGTFRMSSGQDSTSRIMDEGETKIQVRMIDDILEGEKVTCPIFIKMDIEGSELKALRGAEKTIREYKPRLAVCIYHKPEDIVEIPKYIDSLRKDYKFYIRNHSRYGVDTVLYAV